MGAKAAPEAPAKKGPLEYWDQILKHFKTMVRENGSDDDNPLSRWMVQQVAKEAESAELIKKLSAEKGGDGKQAGPQGAKEKAEAKKASKERASMLAKEKKRRKLGDQIIVPSRIDPFLVQALMTSVLTSQYDQLTALCFWNSDIGDKGMTCLANALPSLPSIVKIEVLDSGVSKAGCIALGAALCKPSCKLRILRLDHNAIGSEGLTAIVDGLLFNTTMYTLSLGYCAIMADGGAQLARYVSANNCSVKALDLSGNALGPAGTLALALGLRENTSLTELNLSQNQFGREAKVMQALSQAFRANPNLSKINMDGNLIGNEGVTHFLEQLHDCRHITQFQITPFVDAVGFQMLQEWLEGNQPSKGKGKKGKKGKKKSKKG